MSEPRTVPDTPDILATGDALAAAGRWSAALASWQDAARRDPSVIGGVEQRLTWLLDETGAGSVTERLPSLYLGLVFALATLLGILFVAVAGEPGTTGANFWAVAAWIMIGVAAVASILASRRRPGSEFQNLYQRAERVARQRDAHTSPPNRNA
jgi:hypothetical protein